MTVESSNKMRIAFYLGIEMGEQRRSTADQRKVLELFDQKYHPDRPCRWMSECVLTGTCPHEIACNH